VGVCEEVDDGAIELLANIESVGQLPDHPAMDAEVKV